MELKRVTPNEVKYNFIQFVTFDYLGKVAENIPFFKQSSKTIIETVELQKISIVLMLYYLIWYPLDTCGY